MATNPDYKYANAQEEYNNAKSDEERLQALKLMYQTCPKHKSAEKLASDIKNKIAKLKNKLQKQKKQSKKGGRFSLKKEGAATVALVGTTNTGKSTLLKKLTGAKVEIADYKYTTKKSEVGILDYHGIKLQVVEIPSLFENFEDSPKGPAYLALIRQSDLMVLFFKTPEEKTLLNHELDQANINIPILIYNDQEDIADQFWKRLPLIKVRTKMPGKDPDFPPVALSKGSTIRSLAEHIHKDFLKNFKFARVWGKSAKFDGAQVGLSHILKDNDLVELHMK
ncbi:MAG: GTPase [Candidatus Woesearchaeota archaeon]